MLFSRRRSAVAMFEQRFEADGQAFLFRKGRSGIPIKVTSTERDQFVSDFRVANRLLIALLFGLMLCAPVVETLVYFQRGQEVPALLLQVSIWLLVGAFAVAFFWIWYAPNRALAGRSPSGPPLSREDIKSRAIDRATWPQLLLSLLFAAGLMVDGAVPGPISNHPIKVGFAAVLLVLTIRALLLKFRRRSLSNSAP